MVKTEATPTKGKKMTGIFEDAEIISSYSRAQAIADGVLVDAGNLATEAGFTYPVALTQAAWNDAVAWSPENQEHQDETGRLWDVLTMAAHAARTGGRGSHREFEVLRIPNTPNARRPLLLALEMQIGPGDDAAPVLTIGLPGED